MPHSVISLLDICVQKCCQGQDASSLEFHEKSEEVACLIKSQELVLETVANIFLTGGEQNVVALLFSLSCLKFKTILGLVMGAAWIIVLFGNFFYIAFYEEGMIV